MSATRPENITQSDNEDNDPFGSDSSDNESDENNDQKVTPTNVKIIAVKASLGDKNHLAGFAVAPTGNYVDYIATRIMFEKEGSVNYASKKKMIENLKICDFVFHVLDEHGNVLQQEKSEFPVRALIVKSKKNPKHVNYELIKNWVENKFLNQLKVNAQLYSNTVTEANLPRLPDSEEVATQVGCYRVCSSWDQAIPKDNKINNLVRSFTKNTVAAYCQGDRTRNLFAEGSITMHDRKYYNLVAANLPDSDQANLRREKEEQAALKIAASKKGEKTPENEEKTPQSTPAVV